MKTIADLLDGIKRVRNLETDSALAAALGVSRQTVNNWRQGRNTPDAVACATIAGLSGEPLNLVIGIAGEQRAVSREEKAVWRRLAATATLLLVGVIGVAPAPSHAATSGFESEPVCIMRNYRGVIRWHTKSYCSTGLAASLGFARLRHRFVLPSQVLDLPPRAELVELPVALRLGCVAASD